MVPTDFQALGILRHRTLRVTTAALFVFLAVTASGQSKLRVLRSNTSEDLRGVSVVSREIAWASGTRGTYLRTTDAGRTWKPAQVPDAGTLDFRAIVAFSSDEAFLMSAGPGEQSRIYHTSDSGQHWQLQFTNKNPKGFFDSMAFWDSTHGVVLGDPVPDGSGSLKFELLFTDDGKTWHELPPGQLPPAMEGEGAFAASNTCIAILRTPGKKGASELRETADLWFATGGRVARVFHSPDRGQTWTVVDTPIVHGPESAGNFSVAFRDPLHGVIAGGDYKHPNQDGPNLAFTDDGGKTWTLSSIHPLAYFSAVAYDRGASISGRILAVAQNYLLDLRSGRPHRVKPKKKPAITFNAISAYPDGGGLIVGPKGAIASIQ